MRHHQRISLIVLTLIVAGGLMALELFGPEAGAFAAIACVVSYLFSGYHGIYHAQKLGARKTPIRQSLGSTTE